jgi:hypothetical protein
MRHQKRHQKRHAALENSQKFENVNLKQLGNLKKPNMMFMVDKGE